MILFLLILGGVLLALPGLPRGVPRKFPPRECARIAMASLLAGWLVLELALALIALPTVSHAIGMTEVADACHDVLAPLTNAPAAVGWMAALAGLFIALRLVIGARSSLIRAQAGRAEPWLGQHDARGDFDLVVLPTKQPLAYGAPGDPPQVVISQGTIDRLPDRAFQAVVEHEAAHHRLKHPYYLAALSGIERSLGLSGFVWRSTSRVRDAMELWADDAAASHGTHRHGLRRALLDLGGARPSMQERRRRLARVFRPHPPAFRALWYSPVGVLTSVAALIIVDWLTAAHHAGALGPTCAG